MNVPAEDDASTVGQKFIFSRPEERKIRRRFIYSAMFFEAVAVALILPLCVGGWVPGSNSIGGAVNNGDTHLVTWSATFRRQNTLRESTFTLSWYMSSFCYSESYVEGDFGLNGCLHREPGSPFDLKSIMVDLEARLAEDRNLGGDGGREGAFEGPPGDIDYPASISSTRDALASYGIYLVVSLGTWLCQGISKKHSIRLGSSSWRVMMAAHFLALFALLVASGVTTAAAYKANALLENMEYVFKYHSVGSSFAALTWCAFVSHFLGSIAFAGSVYIWQRLQRPELYPPEPDAEPPVDPARAPRGGPRGQRAYRAQREEPAVHREADPNDIDDELPPYSRIDPNEGREAQGGTEQSRALPESIHLDNLRRDGHLNHPHADNATPAPEYELHQWPPNLDNLRQARHRED